jgi:hypothetical protein
MLGALNTTSANAIPHLRDWESKWHRLGGIGIYLAVVAWQVCWPCPDWRLCLLPQHLPKSLWQAVQRINTHTYTSKLFFARPFKPLLLWQDNR